MRIILAVQPYNLNNAHLQQLIHPQNVLINPQYPLDRLWHCAMRQEHKCIPLARRVRLLELLVDGDFADVGVAVFEAAAADWDERLEEFGVLGYFLEEEEGCTANIFIGALLGSSAACFSTAEDIV